MTKLTTWQATIQDDDTGAAIVSPVVTIRLGGPAGALADLFDIAGSPLVVNPVTGGIDGFVQVQMRPGRYWVQAADGGTFSNAWYVDVMPEEGLSWATRSEFVTDWAAGMNLPDGSVVNAGGLQYEIDSAATAITDLVGVKPFDDVTPNHFGENATPGTTDMTAHLLSAISFAKEADRIVRLLGETYVSDAITLDSIRGLRFVGEFARDPLASNAATWIYWKSGSTSGWLMAIKSCANVSFEHVNFFSNGNTGKPSLVEFQCNESTAVAPKNKFASTGISFDGCSFVVSVADTMSVATINLKSAAIISIKRGNIYGSNAIKLGADTDVDPDTGGATIPDGRVVTVSLSEIILYGDIVRERVTGVNLTDVYFGKNSVDVVGEGYSAAMVTSGNEEVRSEVLTNVNVDSDGVTRNHQYLIELPSSPPSGIVPTMTVIGGSFQSARQIFHIPSGKLSVSGATFIGQSRAGGTGTYCAARLSGSASSVELTGNGYDGLLALNSGFVVAQVLVDDRSVKHEGSKLLLARSLPTSTGIALTGSWQTILSRTIAQAEGGRVKVSYNVALSSSVDTTFAARIVINGVPVDASYQRFTTNTASAKLFNLSCSPTIAEYAASLYGGIPTIELQVYQSTGASLATVQGDNSTWQRTTALVEVI